MPDLVVPPCVSMGVLHMKRLRDQARHLEQFVILIAAELIHIEIIDLDF